MKTLSTVYRGGAMHELDIVSTEVIFKRDQQTAAKLNRARGVSFFLIGQVHEHKQFTGNRL